jgi:hypothetical protein
MKIVDLTHVMNVHTPGWVGYAGNNVLRAEPPDGAHRRAAH